jgi:hypothetical protein
MDADFSVELGAGDPVLEMPWSDPDGRLQYQNLRRQPEALALITEATDYRELAEFLEAVNSQASILESAKCDVWTEDELSEAENFYEAEIKFTSYVDLLFCDEPWRFDFSMHESFADRAVEALQDAPELSAAAEFVIRRCYYKVDGNDAEDVSKAGFYFTLYLSGYGNDEDEARKQWAAALTAVRGALLLTSAEIVGTQS